MRPGTRCPRHANPPGDASSRGPARAWIGCKELCGEPFRLLFPIAVLSGLIGVALWPLLLGGFMEAYPGVWHIRIMIEGFFGGFMFGFLGTSLPKLLEVRPWGMAETGSIALLQLASTAAHAVGSTGIGDACFAAAFAIMITAVLVRLPQRRDLPPPGFVLVGLGWLTAFAGIGLDHWAARSEGDSEATSAVILLSRLWLGHGFVLLGILGAGGFLLPRFLGLGIRERFESSPTPSRAWMISAGVGLLAGVLLLGSYAAEAAGYSKSMASLRALVVVAYCLRVMPLERLRWSSLGVQPYLLLGLGSIPIGIALSGWLSGWRIAWSHLELVAGFGLITLGVGTRVIFGHSGRRERLDRVHVLLALAGALMLIGMASRMSGDLLPRLQKSHYLYGALNWIAGLILWSFVVLPSVLRPDSDAGETPSAGAPGSGRPMRPKSQST